MHIVKCIQLQFVLVCFVYISLVCVCYVDRLLLLYLGYNINETLKQWNNLLSTHMPQNGYVSMGGGGMDASGAIIGVNELLLQSWCNNTIRLFPVYNFGNASFSTLRAVGAFLVSSSMINGVVQSPVDIYSEKGNICNVLSPWKNDIKICKVDNSDSSQCTDIGFQCDSNFICTFHTDSNTHC